MIKTGDRDTEQLNWEVIALRYASKELIPSHLQLDSDPHDAAGKLDYFIWLCRAGERIILVDTGFERAEGASRGRIMHLDPIDGLARLGVKPEQVTDIFITHLHYDHAGNLNLYPNAKIHIQEQEMSYATGRCMCHPRMRQPFSVDAVVTAVRLVYKDRVIFHNGDCEIAPGLYGKLIGGHSKGLQMMLIGERNPLVLASDGIHLRRYLRDDHVFPVFSDYYETVEGYRTLREMEACGAEIIPGHDPDVLEIYPRVFADWADAVYLRR